VALKDEESVREAWKTLMRKADALRIDCRGVLVQAMVEGGLELFVGGVRDQQFGPIVLFGLGGIRVEEVGQVGVALAPLERAEIESLITLSPCSGVIQDREDGGLLDRAAVIDAISAVAKLIVEPSVLAIDVNPLIALPHGIAVVDCKVIVDADRTAITGMP
jgi:succinyl-CoA synthetase beta subunit